MTHLFIATYYTFYIIIFIKHTIVNKKQEPLQKKEKKELWNCNIKQQTRHPNDSKVKTGTLDVYFTGYVFCSVSVTPC